MFFIILAFLEALGLLHYSEVQLERVLRCESAEYYQVAISARSGRCFVAYGGVNVDRAGAIIPKNGVVRVFDRNTGELQAELSKGRAEAKVISLAGNGTMLASLDESGKIIVWNVEKRVPILEVACNKDDPAMALSRDGQLLVIADEKHMEGWNVQTNTRDWIRTYNWGRKHNRSPSSIEVSADNKLVACGFSDGSFGVFDIEAKTWLSCKIGHSAPVLSIAFGKECRHLFTGGGDSRLRCSNVKSGEEVFSIFVGAPVRALQLSSSGSHFLFHTRNSIYIHCANTGVLFRKLLLGVSFIEAACFSEKEESINVVFSRGQLIIGTIRVANLNGGKEKRNKPEKGTRLQGIRNIKSVGERAGSRQRLLPGAPTDPDVPN